MPKKRELFMMHHWRRYGVLIRDEWQSSHAEINQEFISLIAGIINNPIEQDDIESVQKLNSLRKEIPADIWRKYANKVSKENSRQNKSLISDLSTEKLNQLAMLLDSPNKSKKELIEYALNITVALLDNKLIQGRASVIHDDIKGFDELDVQIDEYDLEDDYQKDHLSWD